MNNTNPLFLITNIKLTFDNPWLLLISIPVIILCLIPYFRLGKRRHTRNRVTSLIFHILVILISTSVLAGIKMDGKELVTSETMIVVDVSDSTKQVNDEIDSYVTDLLKEIDKDSKIGLITYADDANLCVKLCKNSKDVIKEYKNSTREKKYATNTSLAISCAINSFSKYNVDKRIILITDTLDTDGALNTNLAQLKAKNIKVDGIFFNPKNYDGLKEAQVTSLELPENVSLHQMLAIKTNIKTHAMMSATVKLYDNDKQVLSGEYELKKGDNELELNYAFDEANLHTLKVEIVSDEDLVSENNYYYTYVNINSNEKILVITNKDYQKAKALLDDSFTVDVVNPSQAPDLSGLIKYGEVILMDVNNSDLPSNYDAILEQYVKNNQGSLLTTGGKDTYFNGNMENTKFNDMLPIDVVPNDKNSKAVVIVLDVSHSMRMSENNLANSNKLLIDIAKQGLRDSVNTAFNEFDYVGIITFWKESNTICELTPASHKEELINKINSIEATTKGGTVYNQAIIDAGTMLKSCTEDVMSKHILFISDGDSANKSNADYKKVIENYYLENNITTSTIALGEDVKFSEVQEMATLGHGNSYQVTKESQFSSYVYNECKSVASDPINDGNYKVYVSSITPATKDVDFTTIPNVTGYNGVSSKKNVTTVLRVINDNNHDPIYSYWNYGNGKAASLMIDINSDWSTNILNYEDGVKFFRNIVADNFIKRKAEEASSILIDFQDNNVNTIVKANCIDNSDSFMKIKVINPDNTIYNDTLDINADTFYKNIKTYEGGLYKVELTKYSNSGVYEDSNIAYVTYSYSNEYDTFYDTKTSLENLNKFCNETTGRVYSKEDNIANTVVSAQYVKTLINLQLPLILIALILYLLDIIVRKFNFLWIHEIITGKRKNLTE